VNARQTSLVNQRFLSSLCGCDQPSPHSPQWKAAFVLTRNSVRVAVFGAVFGAVFVFVFVFVFVVFPG
jgi:hypothetical protein